MSGMAEVLAGHQNWATTNDSADGIWRMMCFDCKADLGPYESGKFDNIFAAHQADLLTEAGFGPVKEAGAVALEEAADVLKPSGVLWWGGEGVYVAEERHAPPSGTLDAWLRARAAKLRASIA